MFIFGMRNKRKQMCQWEGMGNVTFGMRDEGKQICQWEGMGNGIWDA